MGAACTVVGGTAAVLEQLTEQEWERIHALAVGAEDLSKVQLSGIPHEGKVAYALAQASGARYALKMWEQSAQDSGLPHLPKVLRVFQHGDRTLVEIAEPGTNQVLRFREQLPDGVQLDNLPRELIVAYTLPFAGLPQRLVSISFSNGTMAQVVFDETAAPAAALPSHVQGQQATLPSAVTAQPPSEQHQSPAGSVAYSALLPEHYLTARVGPGAVAQALGLDYKRKPELASSGIFSGSTRARSAPLGDIVALAEEKGWLKPENPEVFHALVAAAGLPELDIVVHTSPGASTGAPSKPSPPSAPSQFASSSSPDVDEVQRALHKAGPFSLYVVAYSQSFRGEGIFAGLNKVLVHNPHEGTYLSDLGKLSGAPPGSAETYIFNPERFELGVAVDLWTTQNSSAPRVTMRLKNGEKKIAILKRSVDDMVWKVPDNTDVYLGLDDSIPLYDETMDLISRLAKSEGAAKVLEYAHRRMPGNNGPSLELLAAMLLDNKPRLIDSANKSTYEQRIALDALSILALTTRTVDGPAVSYGLNRPFLAALGYTLEEVVRTPAPAGKQGSNGTAASTNGLGALPEGVDADLAQKVYGFMNSSGKEVDNNDLIEFAHRQKIEAQEVFDVVGLLVKKGLVNETDPSGVYQMAKGTVTLTT